MQGAVIPPMKIEFMCSTDYLRQAESVKVVFSNSLPFSLAHGGVQTVVEALMRELPKHGVDVEAERWEDASQRSDILHYFGRPFSVLPVRLAQAKGRRVVMTEYLDQTASRGRGALWLQRRLTRLAQVVMPGLVHRLAWDVYRELDAMIYTTELEWRTARYLFEARSDRGHIVPHGLEASALSALGKSGVTGDYLISVATIDPRKNSVRLARAAKAAKVPVVFLGKPYSEGSGYFSEFQSLVDNRWVRYPGYVSEEVKHRMLREARGFVLGSEFESGCVAVYEAAAARLPLLLANRPWARSGYPLDAEIAFVEPSSHGAFADGLRVFYETAVRGSKMTFTVFSWGEIAERYKRVYQAVRS
jgi:glycosyltransferase involved in cell wall biosynthesis